MSVRTKSADELVPGDVIIGNHIVIPGTKYTLAWLHPLQKEEESLMDIDIAYKGPVTIISTRFDDGGRSRHPCRGRWLIETVENNLIYADPVDISTPTRGKFIIL